MIVAPLISAVLTALNWLCSYCDSLTDPQLVNVLPNWSAVILSFFYLFSQFHVIFAYVVFWSVLVFVSALMLFSVQDYKGKTFTLLNCFTLDMYNQLAFCKRAFDMFQLGLVYIDVALVSSQI